jgi:hypothetical protein
MSNKLTRTLPREVILLFKRRGAAVDDTTITTTTDVVRKTVNRFLEKLLIARGGNAIAAIPAGNGHTARENGRLLPLLRKGYNQLKISL